MQLSEIIALRDKLRAELVTVEKFLEIARKNLPESSNIPATPIVETGGVWGIPPIKITSVTQPDLLSGRDYGAIGRAVLSAIALCPKRYSYKDVKKAASDMGTELTDKAIATALRRLVSQGKINVFSEGRGRKAAVYQKD